MTEHYSFFDAIQDSNGGYDREYNAQQFTDYFKSLINTGVMRSAYNQLQVTANSSNMKTTAGTGIAFVEGRYYYNDAPLELTHDTEVVGMNRIDRIVVRLNLDTAARSVRAFIKKGAPNISPVPPVLTQTPNLYEISLAQVRVIGGQGFIKPDAITDERIWAGSDILPSYDDNALAKHMTDTFMHTTQQEKNYWNNYVYHHSDDVLTGNVDFHNLPWGYMTRVADVTNSLNAPPESNGILFTSELSSATWGEMVFKSVVSGNIFTCTHYDGNWTPWIRVMNEKDYNVLFQSVSNGKAQVANAITQKGVPTAANAEFATMAANILNLTGFAAGTRTVTENGVLSVDGLTFAPKVVFATIGAGETAGHVYVEKISIAKGYVVGIFDGASQMQPGQPPIELSPVYIRHKADAVFTNSSFAIPIKYNGVYTWYAYG